MTVKDQKFTQRLQNAYTKPRQRVRSLSESGSDRDQKRNKNKNVTRGVRGHGS